MSLQRNAQIAMEFMYFLAVTAVVFFIVVGIFSARITNVRSQHDYELFRQIAVQAREELKLAATVEPGYSRTFELPVLLAGSVPYSITINGTTLVASANDMELVMPVSEVTGQPRPGLNTINTTDTAVILNG
ncbi:hypothetical protein J4475_00765 [Candidatus Woesearchaeota archaeon]|nr:hypothetical protein [Candidatus Woesearchaeota archaeon]